MATKEKKVEEKTVDEAQDYGAGVPEGASKTNMMSVFMHKLGEMEKDQIVKFFDKMMSSMDSKALTSTMDSSAHSKNLASVAMHGAIKEDIKAIFGDENISDEFKEKATRLFESAVDAKVAIVKAELEDEKEKVIQGEIEKSVDVLAEMVEAFADHIAELWLQENEVAIHRDLVAEMAIDFMSGLHKLFMEHNITVPDGKTDVVEALTQKVTELEENLDDSMRKSMELMGILVQKEKDDLVTAATTGMKQLDADKFKKLAENVEYDGDADSFKEKLEFLKKNANAPKKPNGGDTGIIQEETPAEDQKPSEVVPGSIMDRYVRTVSKQVGTN